MLKPGDIVNISKDAVYWNGTSIPDYIIQISWKIASISNDRVILGESANGLKKLNKPIHQKFLNLI